MQSRYPRPQTARLRIVPLPEDEIEAEADAVQAHSGRTGTTDPTPAAATTQTAGTMSFTPAGEQRVNAEPNGHPLKIARSPNEITVEYPPPAEAGPVQSSVYAAGIGGQPVDRPVTGYTEEYPPFDEPEPQNGHDQGHYAHQHYTPEPMYAQPAPRPDYAQPPAQRPTDPMDRTLEYVPQGGEPSFHAAQHHAAPGVHIPELVSGSGWQREAVEEIHLVLVKRDGSDGESFSITGQSVTLGRTAGDLRFPDDEFLGAYHARIERTEHGLSVVDLNSVNGVYLRISTPEPVYPGDVFLLGHQLLRLENVPESGREHGPTPDGVRVFGTPLPPAWGRLVLLGYGGCEAETYYLRPRQVVFGRELGDIVYPTDAFISRRHACLSMDLHGDSMSVTLEDLESANGTYLRVRGSAHLQHDDMFRVGDQIFRVRIL